MLTANCNSLHYCRDLQKLIKVTLEQVIKPLRKELKSRDSFILKMEIEDAENKTFEFIALQISAIFNSSDNREDLIKEFLNSRICFECLDIDEDTMLGFLLIRGINILELLDMEDEKVRNLLLFYANPIENVESVIAGLEKIRINMELVETAQTFKEDTRELIKMVVQLTAQKCDFTSSETCGIFLSPDIKPPRKSSGLSIYEPEISGNENPIFDYDSGDGPLTFQVKTDRDSLSSPAPGESGYSSRQQQNEHLLNTTTIAYYSLINPPHSNQIGGLDQMAIAKALHSGEDSLPYFLSSKDSLSVPSTPALTKSHNNQTEISSGAAGISSSSAICTPAAGDTPPASPSIGGKRSRVPGTPPPKLRLKLVANPLHKSRSHESNLSNRVQTDNNHNTNANADQSKSAVGIAMVMDNIFFPNESDVNASNTLSPRDGANVTERRSSCEERRLVTRPPPSPKHCAQDREEGDMYPSNHLIVPGNQSHRFEVESKLTSIASRCVICNHRRFFKIQNCVNCKIKVCKNKNCMSQVTHKFPCHGIYKPSDGSSDPKSSPNTARKSSNNNTQQNLRPAHSSPGFNSQLPGSDSTSVSSNNSSTPGSPFFENQHSPRPRINHIQIFEFPSISESSSDKSPLTKGLNVSNTSDNSKLVSDSGNVTATSNNHSNGDDKDMYRLDSVDSQDEAAGLLRANSISVTLREWDIPMESLQFGEILGVGSFGTVYQGKWHGEVAIKRLDLDENEAEGKTRLDTFKREVATLHKTRHENLVLFMGACMKPPHLAIVTQLSKGETLYAQLHVRKQAIPIARAITIASQVAKGMGYLHAKNIVHKDLKTKNIFLESNSKAVIGDFGLFDFMRLRKKTDSGNYLSIPSGWLCYLAPEIIRKLNLHCSTSDPEHALPFTPHSDIYAFGTVWYELLTMEWPFKSNSPESIILLVGKGLKQTLNLVPGTKDFKEILLQCWTYTPEQRPEFTNLVKSLDRLPKLYRSPSYPVKSVAVSWSHENLAM